MINSNIRQWLLPLLKPICPACEQSQPDGLLCATCATYLETLNEPCKLCGEPNIVESVCGRCLQTLPPWDAVAMRWSFTGLSRHLIHQFKYHHDIAAAEAMIKIWCQETDLSCRPEALVAVPMHHRKHAKKGYNQADILAKRLSTQLSIPVWRGIQRQIATPPLEGLSKKERKKELKDAFRLTATPPKTVAIIDDVFTSGATMAEISRLLKRQGCQFVAVWTLARTPLP